VRQTSRCIGRTTQFSTSMVIITASRLRNSSWNGVHTSTTMCYRRVDAQQHLGLHTLRLQQVCALLGVHHRGAAQVLPEPCAERRHGARCSAAAARCPRARRRAGPPCACACRHAGCSSDRCHRGGSTRWAVTLPAPQLGREQHTACGTGPDRAAHHSPAQRQRRRRTQSCHRRHGCGRTLPRGRPMGTLRPSMSTVMSTVNRHMTGLQLARKCKCTRKIHTGVMGCVRGGVVGKIWMMICTCK
jgi:hypothetical protein